MIPGADMFNHDPNQQSVQIGTDGDDYFVMRTVSTPSKRNFLSSPSRYFLAVTPYRKKKIKCGKTCVPESGAEILE